MNNIKWILHDTGMQKATSCHRKYHCITKCFVHKSQWGLRELWVLPTNILICPGRMGGKKKRSIKWLGNTVALAGTSSADIAVVSAYKNPRRVWYYAGWRKTLSNRNYCGSCIFSIRSCYRTVLLTMFVLHIKRALQKGYVVLTISY